MPHLPARPHFGLAVMMHHDLRLSAKFDHPANLITDKIFHQTITMTGRITQRQARNGANMLLKLRNRAGRLRPMAGIMHARRNLIGN